MTPNKIDQKIQYRRDKFSRRKLMLIFSGLCVFFILSYMFWPYLAGSDARDLTPENPVGTDLISSFAPNEGPSGPDSRWESISRKDLRDRLTSMHDYIDPFEQYTYLEYATHEVDSGESLWSIAQIYGRSIYSIASANYDKLVKYGYLPEGLSLRIPNRDGIMTELSSGQTLWDLQNSYNISYKKILKFNEISSTSKLKQNMELFIPGARPLNTYKYRFDQGELSGKFIWPVDPRSRRITSGFGKRNHPVLEKELFHNGIDISGSYGAPAYSASEGKVRFVGKIKGYGNVVTVVHSHRLKTLYAHLSAQSVKPGQYVEKGEKLGKIGSTGHATGPHLHFEIRISGKPVNPVDYLP
ncbi:MAG: peptidoglycan DD-metalloendopeptidase family protein [bacterium]